uniref:Signal recognition particle receptor subunit beta n=1 Tax=Mesocestoides corti TaxID=53468 RepID=A0A5K3FFH3_MESCO
MLYIILGASVFVLLLLGYLFLGVSRKSTVLITGICDSGKTALFVMLVHKKNAMTFTSLAPNTEDYKLKTRSSRTLKIVDVPGLEKLRFECVNKYKTNTAGVIFVVDSSKIQALLKDTAEYLFNLMTDGILARNRTPFLILCNKNDVPGAKNAVAVEKMLETELTTLCRTKAGGLAALDGHNERQTVPIVRPDEAFSFAKNKLHRVTFADCSAVSTDISPVRLWLERL